MLKSVGLRASEWNQVELFLEVLKTERDKIQLEGMIRECLVMNKSLIHIEARS